MKYVPVLSNMWDSAKAKIDWHVTINLMDFDWHVYVNIDWHVTIILDEFWLTRRQSVR